MKYGSGPEVGKVAVGSIRGAMVIDMDETRWRAQVHLRAFLEGIGDLQFGSWHRQAVLKRLPYPRLKRADPGRRWAIFVHSTGYRRQQVIRRGGADPWALAGSPSATVRRHRALPGSTRPPPGRG